MPTIATHTTDVARWTPLVRIVGRSMQPTLAHGRILLTRPAATGVAVGDAVVFTGAHGARCVKRIAAGPGDVVEIEAGLLYVNGRPLAGRRPRIAGAYVQRWCVPPGHYFVVGDNLQESHDSRVWQEPFVAESRISGVALEQRHKGPRHAAAGTFA